MVNDLVDIQLVQQRIAVLACVRLEAIQSIWRSSFVTFETEAVNTTTS